MSLMYHKIQCSAMVQEYYIYKDLWDALISEELSCQRKAENCTNPFAVAVMKDNNRTKLCCNRCTCIFVPETFIGMNFHEIVLPRKKAKIITLRHSSGPSGYKFRRSCVLDSNYYIKFFDNLSNSRQVDILYYLKTRRYKYIIP